MTFCLDFRDFARKTQVSRVRQTAAQYNKVGKGLSWDNIGWKGTLPNKCGVSCFLLGGWAPSGGQFRFGSLGEIARTIIEF